MAKVRNKKESFWRRIKETEIEGNKSFSDLRIRNDAP